MKEALSVLEASADNITMRRQSGDPLRWLAKGWFVLMGIMFLLSGTMKLLEYDNFLDQLDGYLLVPETWLSAAASAIILTELLLGAGLLIPGYQRGCARGAMALLALFTTAIGASFVNQLKIDCGCFGSLFGPSDISWWLVARNVGLIAITAFASAGVNASQNRIEVSATRHEATEAPSSLSPFAHACAFLRERIILPFFSNRWSIMGGVCTMGMFVLAIGYTQKNRILADQMEVASALFQSGLQDGDIVKAFRAVRLEKTAERIEFSKAEKTWVLIFSPNCPHCQNIMPVWNQLWTNKNQDASTRIVGMSTQPQVPPEFIRKYGVQFPIYVPTNLRRFSKNWKVTRVPQAVLIDAEGRVLKVLKS